MSGADAGANRAPIHNAVTTALDMATRIVEDIELGCSVKCPDWCDAGTAEARREFVRRNLQRWRLLDASDLIDHACIHVDMLAQSLAPIEVQLTTATAGLSTSPTATAKTTRLTAAEAQPTLAPASAGATTNPDTAANKPVRSAAVEIQPTATSPVPAGATRLVPTSPEEAILRRARASNAALACRPPMQAVLDLWPLPFRSDRANQMQILNRVRSMLEADYPDFQIRTRDRSSPVQPQYFVDVLGLDDPPERGRWRRHIENVVAGVIQIVTSSPGANVIGIAPRAA